MKAHLVSGLLFTCFVALGAVGGCAVDVDPQRGDEATVAESDAIIIPGGKYVTVKKDLRRCAAPLCGGYFITEIGAHTPSYYVSRFDFMPMGFDADLVTDVVTAPDHDLILRGIRGEPEPRFHTRTFRVSEVYRGLPQIRRAPDDVLFRVHERRPPIYCFAAPCDNQIAVALGAPVESEFTSFAIEHALAPGVDPAFVLDRVQHHGAIVAAHLAPGHEYPAGTETLLDVSQVYIRLPIEPASCTPRPHVICPDGQVNTYTRTADRCLVFDACADHSQCPRVMMPVCLDGYVRHMWPTDDLRCVGYACDPAFVEH